MRTRDAVLIVVVAVTLSVLAYANSFPNGFHFDDGHSIQDNAWLRDLRYIPRYFWDVSVFSPLAENRSYRPVLLTGFALSHALGGGAPWAYHLGSILLHALAAATIGLLTARLWRAERATDSAEPPTALTGYAAGALAAAVMAAHPLASEAVNYVSARSSLQASAFMFVSVWLYIRGREDNHRTSVVWSGFVLLLAMGTKIIAVTAPALVLVWALTLGPERPRDSARRVPTWPRWRSHVAALIPIAAIAFGFTIFHEWIVGGDARSARSAVAPLSFLWTQTRVWVHYQRLFVWPEDLCADLTMAWSASPLEGPVARALLWTIVVVIIALSLWRRRPMFTFGVAWYYIALSPTNSFVPLSEPASEHRVYIALPGLIWAALAISGMLFDRWPLSRKARIGATAGAALVVVGLVATTLSRNLVWRTGETLWGDVLTCAPDNGRAHLNYGRALMAKGDLTGAAASFRRCSTLWPNWIFCRINQAVLALRENRVREADRHMAVARRLQPDNVYTLSWSAQVYLAQRRFDAAAEAFRRALKVAPGFLQAKQGLADALVGIGQAADQRGQRTAAIDAYTEALNVAPGHAAAQNGLRQLTSPP